jgi:hypothetical protein
VDIRTRESTNRRSGEQETAGERESRKQSVDCGRDLPHLELLVAFVTLVYLLYFLLSALSCSARRRRAGRGA